MTQIKSVPFPEISGQPVANFDKSAFDTLIFTKGLEVIHERAIVCPCRQKGGTNLVNCRNCMGTGWIFIDPQKTRMIIHSINHDTQFKNWSEERRGTASISSRDDIQLSFMDRVTAVDFYSILSQMIYTFIDGDDLYARTIYGVQDLLYLFQFDESSKPLKKIIEGFEFKQPNLLKFDRTIFTDEFYSFSITYKHNLQYHIIDLVNDVRKSVIIDHNEVKEIQLPVHAMARRAHYVLDADNVAGNFKIDN